MAIPKIIHYCWFGGKGNEIKRWDETNCTFDENEFVRKAYRDKKYGFIGDYYRAKVLYEYGRIYLDTDVVVNRGFDDLLGNDAFIDFFYNVALCTAVVGATKCSSFIKGILNMYDTGHYETKKTVIDGEKVLLTFTRMHFLCQTMGCGHSIY